MKHYKTKNNTLYIDDDTKFNRLDLFAEAYIELLASDLNPGSNMYIVLDNRINIIQNDQIKTLLNMAYLTKELGRKLYIKCNHQLKTIISTLDNDKLLELVS